jgi:hypothetical protein
MGVYEFYVDDGSFVGCVAEQRKRRTSEYLAETLFEVQIDHDR